MAVSPHLLLNSGTGRDSTTGALEPLRAFEIGASAR
jgi:hypothetical protein